MRARLAAIAEARVLAVALLVSVAGAAAASTPAGCAPATDALCLGGRFTVTASWRTSTASGAAFAHPLTADSGYLWFFAASNVEAVVKVLNGCSLNDRYWVFAGGLTNVEVVLTVTDTATGDLQTYTNPQGEIFQPIQDTNAFATCSAAASDAPRPAIARAPPAPGTMSDEVSLGPTVPFGGRRATSGSGSCVASPTALCLNGGRFRVMAQFDAGGGNAGVANVVQLTPDTGYLWFFAASNVEALVKVLDGCGLNGDYWVFAGGLTNVNVALTVTDTRTGSVQTYTNPPRTMFQPIQDTSAFATCSAAADDPPHAVFTVNCSGMTCTVAPSSYDNDATPVARWLWNWGDGTPTVEPTTPYRWAEQTHTYAQSGNYTITHTVYDTAGLSDSTSLGVLANLPPVAANDSATTYQNLPVTFDLLGNDSDPDGDVLNIANVDLRVRYPGADYAINSNGSAITVTPPNAFVGTLTFTYQAVDPWGGASAPATVSVVVQESCPTCSRESSRRPWR